MNLGNVEFFLFFIMLACFTQCANTDSIENQLDRMNDNYELINNIKEECTYKDQTIPTDCKKVVK